MKSRRCVNSDVSPEVLDDTERAQMTIDPINSKARLQARRRFAELLAQRNTRERDWQELFSDCPHILSESLPVDLSPEDIVVGGRPGISETDFYIYPKEKARAPCFGAIELKRPRDKILRTPRRNLLDFSATASCAIRQAQQGIQNLRAKLSIDPRRAVLLGNDHHVFVIMGLSHELVQTVQLALMDDQFRDIVTERHCRIIPYDTLLRMYERSFPTRLQYLALQEGTSHRAIHQHLTRVANPAERLFVAANNGWDDSAVTLLLEKPDLNRRFGPQSSTALLWASFYGDLFLVLRLLQEGADVNVRDGLGRAPLWAAAVNNHVDVTQLLLEHGADVAAMDYPGWTYILLYERRAFYSEIRRLLASYGYTDDREAITSSTWSLISMRETLLSRSERYVDLIPMLREKYLWLHETAGKIQAGVEVFAVGTSGPEEDLRNLEMQLKNPYLVLMKLGVSYCRSGNYADGIKELSAIMIDREREARQPHLEVDTFIGRVELGNLYYLTDDIESARREWNTALVAAKELGAASAIQHLLDCLAVVESEDLSARTRLTESLKRRSG